MKMNRTLLITGPKATACAQELTTERSVDNFSITTDQWNISCYTYEKRLNGIISHLKEASQKSPLTVLYCGNEDSFASTKRVLDEAGLEYKSVCMGQESFTGSKDAIIREIEETFEFTPLECAKIDAEAEVSYAKKMARLLMWQPQYTTSHGKESVGIYEMQDLNPSI